VGIQQSWQLVHHDAAVAVETWELIDELMAVAVMSPVEAL